MQQSGLIRKVVGRRLLFGATILCTSILSVLPSNASTAEGVSAYEAGDYHAALNILRNPAREGDRVAQYYLGLIFTYGQGTTADPSAGVGWYDMAAKQGYAPAEAELGLAYLQGEGVEKDLVVARNWLERAALNGSADAAYNLATLYKDGHGVPQDIETAFYWYTWSIRSGMSDEAHELGLLYLDHGSEPRHRVLGYMWILIAVKDGDTEAVADVKRFRSQLSSAERAEAAKLAEEWPK
jgi:TPR repeat protein